MLTYVERWPLVVHMLSAILCLSGSAIFHLFYVHSAEACSFFSKIDYSGICFLIMGSSYPPIWYTYSCEPVYHIRYLFLAVITSTCSVTFIMIMHPFFARPEASGIKAAMFIFLGLSAAAPFFYLNYSE